MLANRLLHEQKKNRQLSQLSPSSERAPPNWMVPRASEFDENSLPRSLSPTSEFSCECLSCSVNLRYILSIDLAKVY